MTFKANWEKTDSEHQLQMDMPEKMLQLAYPNKKLLSQEIIGGGCANLNIKIQLEGVEAPLILRIYLRDKTSAVLEQKIGFLLKKKVPVPVTHYIGDFEDYRFAITEFIPGITLRDLLLSEEPHDIGDVMMEVGEVLAEITKQEFSMAGFFDENLTVVEQTPKEFFFTFAKDCLQNKNVIAQLSEDTISKINYYLNEYGHFFSDEEKHLVHADFDPANILVDKINDQWTITGVLDWEFSFSGPVLCDVANMLRYAHHMPPQYEEAFLRGLKSHEVKLPENWRSLVHLLNLVSLLDILKRSDPKTRPNQCRDIYELINHILKELDAMQEHVVCIGNKVHRPAGQWTQQVHKLLLYLRQQGFNQAPVPLGFDQQGREILSFLEGQISDYPLSKNAASITALTSAAKLLRAYHDVSQNFLNENPPSQDWMLPSKSPQEVICHGDFAPYNLVLEGEKTIGMIDFDAAHPGPRAWDIAYALYRFAPFTGPDNEDGFGKLEDQILRARLFCDAYGLSQENRVGLVNLIIERLQALIDFMMRSAHEGSKKMEFNIREGHHLKYLTDIEYIKLNKRQIEEGL